MNSAEQKKIKARIFGLLRKREIALAYGNPEDANQLTVEIANLEKRLQERKE